MPALVLAVLPFLHPPAAPSYGVDPSWRWALAERVLARAPFGPDFAFTYGPWGWLDAPVAVHPVMSFAAMAVAAASAVTLFRCLRGAMPGGWASTVGLAVVVGAVVWVLTPASTLLFCALVVSAIGSLEHPVVGGRWVWGWPPVVALLLQVKFSVGVAAVVVLLAVGAGLRPVRRALGAVAVLLGTSAVLWLATGSHLDDVPGWVATITQIAAGYTDAMSVEGMVSPLRGYLPAAVLALGIAVLAVVRAWTGPRSLGRFVQLAVLVGVPGWFAVKQGFVRNDAYHEAFFFLLAGCLLVALGSRVLGRATVAVLAVPTVLAVLGSVQPGSVGPARATEEPADRVAVSAPWAGEDLEAARARNRAEAAIDPDIVDAVRNRRVVVDPAALSVADAYGFTLVTLPIPQAYSAYTPSLDLRNTTALRAAGDAVVLRGGSPLEVSQGLSPDGKNGLWDPPGVQLAMMCELDVTRSSSNWLLLERHGRRCGAPTVVASHRVTSGQAVEVPAAAPGTVVTASFRADPAPLADRFLGLAFKVPHHLRARLDDREFRLPSALAPGQLALTWSQCPTCDAMAAQSKAPLGVRTVSFNESGHVEFQTRSLGS